MSEKRKKKPKTKGITTNKMALWLRAYLDEGARTFLNKGLSAKAAGYKCKDDACFQSIGCENFRKLRDIIEKWLDENALSEAALKAKMLSLVNAKEIKFFSEKGVVTDQREVEAIETQRKTLDMALKVKGMYAPERHEHTGKDGKPLFFETLIPQPDKE